MTQQQELALYATPEHDCSYLPGMQASTVFADPKVIIDTDTYSELSAQGFRRSGQHYYRPHCTSCQACTPIRVSAPNFQRSKSQKRVWNKNSQVKGKILPADFHEDHYLLYEKYIHSRHADGDMYPPSRDQYRSFLVNGHSTTQFIEFSEGDHLLGIAVCDQLNDGLSAIYTFFDPELSAKSLGTYAILWQVEEAKNRELSYLYLGYFIKECKKMAYKTKFSPFEARIGDQWYTEEQLINIRDQLLSSSE
ncbi:MULTISPECIES: arginyltransferase [unclassified Oleiphilus]|uniref:arginyltransferase n=1 Tax=unclassified Oleiphilus TaxID=2631174 RepID=UPI0007C2E59D|nr:MULTISPECIES: arginyltransferase [unclassified Oleiphilus]KZY72912.1 arginyltransferase [Oleiphilus sp. HI0068]KZY75617.1 arginyltransferase [Oleiphilus sp. HI0069]KZY95070.1 arginyltransferase [Oleiphilus sp. HI0072]KZZ08922.1 arginyltransferase [Oleiphilus sp. HI0078]KZZ19705.1 arginyltransferase [Oleiphilus sp. HI0081]